MRGDDGVGPAVAEGVERLGLPGVRVEVCHQLTPEWACRVSEAAGVVFVDAGEAILSADGGVRVRELDGSATSMGWSGHRFTPEFCWPWWRNSVGAGRGHGVLWCRLSPSVGGWV